ncbi:MAG TPA: head GIN domain-containing protein, partial [Bacteroidales bacterium]|nr:head GIN domain-containing protein [Bacteroidales bacterium]
MKKAVFLSLVFVLLAGTSSFASKTSDDRETRDLSGFSSVNFGISGNLYINIGSEFKVVLEGDRSDLKEVITEVRGGKLIIKRDNWRFRMNEKVTVYITMPELDGLGVSGSGKAEVRDGLKGNDLNLGVSGSGKILTGDLNLDRLDCGISGSGNIELGGSGNVSRAEISISGSGNFRGDVVEIGN